MVWKLRFRMHTFLGSFSFFLPDVCCCHFISSIISFLIGDTSSFSSFYTNSFDTACKIEVCFSSSLLIIWSCFLVHFAKKRNILFWSILYDLSVSFTLFKHSNKDFLINIGDFSFYITFLCKKLSLVWLVLDLSTILANWEVL